MNPKGGMSGWRKRNDLLGISRFLLCMFLFYAVINGIGMFRFDISGMQTFLRYFNATVMWGIMAVIGFLDIKRYNLLNYASLSKPKKRSRN